MADIVKAKDITYAKKGYFVFTGSYPRMKHKYVKTKFEAEALKKKWDKIRMADPL